MKPDPSRSTPGPDASGSPDPLDFRVLFESLPGLYLILDPALIIVAVSDAYLHATMTRRELILGRTIFDVFPDNPDDPEATGERNLRDSLARVVHLRAPDAMAVQKYDIRRPASEGGGFEERYWSPVNHPVFNPNGEVAWIIHRVEDVTTFVRLKQRGTEQDRETEQLRTRTAHMEAEIFARAQELQEANRQLRQAKQQLEDRVYERTLELARTNDVLSSEIAQGRQLEEQLRQAQKMEAFGQLAGGIAHDFNNLLTGINGFAEMMLYHMVPVDEHPELLREIRRAGERAATLTRQLLAFSRKQILQPVPLNLNDLVGELEKMLRRLIGAEIKLQTCCDPALGCVKADAGQIEQVLLNLVVNARDAMPTGGYITIETRNVILDQAYVNTHPEVQPGPFILMAVSDTGCGMDAATRAKIFEPFFTTKEAGKGTGLGLAVVHGIIKQSGGSIEVYSEPDHGTSFKIYLPRHTEPASTHPGATTIVAMPTGTETILLIDDEAIVRETARLALESVGYTVLAYGDGESALRHAESFRGPIHLVLSDVVMPNMSGCELVEQVRLARPDIRILFMSGYTDDAILRHGVQEGMAFLQKPLTPSALCRKVREVLDHAQPITGC
ncbi:MAG TPA: ATP-binding protein [Kiritimatiellia bacterium]|nr:ATP-binding protein [Kiritimatiellia bacterium]HMP32956.1 ATP-binding protein [Kiritimatiellia bacterium]